MNEATKITELKIEKIQQILDHYYPNPPIPLNSINDFTFLCAVVLSAQTTDGKVNEVTKKLFQIVSTPEDMIKLTVTEIQTIIQSVGLASTKSKYLLQLSYQLINQFQSKIPSNYKDLESLSGVGHKTASVIMSQIFHENSFPVDTHVHRLALRWKLCKNNKEKNVNKVQNDLWNIFPINHWNKVSTLILLIFFRLFVRSFLYLLYFFLSFFELKLQFIYL